VIIATCPNCGQVTFPPNRVWIASDEQSYRFWCPGCDQMIDRTASLVIVFSLRSVGVQTVAPVISEDDVAQLVAELEDDEALKEFLA
jgi:predicted RNA-binding Zn-ribbon protein involved in translation (DUF1610 family)